MHPALISAPSLRGDPTGLSPQAISRMEDTAQHISDTERRSMLAERDTTDRYLAAFMSDRIGAELTGRISGIARFGVFVKLDETGADAMIPMRNLGAEYYHYDADSQTLMGADTGQVIALGQRARVKLVEAAPVTGGLIVDMLELDGQGMARGPRRPGGRPGKRGAGPPKRKAAKGRKKAAKTARKVKRTRR